MCQYLVDLIKSDILEILLSSVSVYISGGQKCNRRNMAHLDGVKHIDMLLRLTRGCLTFIPRMPAVNFGHISVTSLASLTHSNLSCP